MTKIRPLADRIVIRPIQSSSSMWGSIHIPALTTDTPQQGEVLAVGPGKISVEGRRVPLSLKPGDLVLFGKYSGTEVAIDDDHYLVMREIDVLATLPVQ